MLALIPANTLRMKRKNNKITIIMMIKKGKSKKIISILLYRRQCAAERTHIYTTVRLSSTAHLSLSCLIHTLCMAWSFISHRNRMQNCVYLLSSSSPLSSSMDVVERTRTTREKTQTEFPSTPDISF